jgi:energy-coupling factor transporter ATP-binding protein EcfA2
VIVSPDDIKDLSEAHLAGRDVVALVDELRRGACSYGEIAAEERDARLPELRAAAAGVLERGDPLDALADALVAAGYGGDLRPALVTYLAATGRVLGMRPGTMPVHLLILGPPSAGKSYTLQVVLSLLPPEAYHIIDAGSPRVMIYDEARLEHRVVVFSEADSLPAGEDNPAASAVRNLLQDHTLHYMVVERDPQAGRFVTREIAKPGPTTLITTSTRRLPPQLDTRVFTLEVADDHAQIGKALRAQAALELSGGGPEPPAELLAFQALLQAEAPWEVVVPFVDRLVEFIAREPAEARIVRDLARLLSLIKAVAVIRHARRRRDEAGRLVAELEDYATVRELIGESYKASSSGASARVRAVVEAVADHVLEGHAHASVTAVAARLGIPKKSAARRVATALRDGWLVNGETRKGYPFQLEVGEPLPSESGLPLPEELGGVTVSRPTGTTTTTDSAAQLVLGEPWGADL